MGWDYFGSRKMLFKFKLLSNGSEIAAFGDLTHPPGRSGAGAENPAPAAYYSPIQQDAQGGANETRHPGVSKGKMHHLMINGVLIGNGG